MDRLGKFQSFDKNKTTMSQNQNIGNKLLSQSDQKAITIIELCNNSPSNDITIYYFVNRNRPTPKLLFLTRFECGGKRKQKKPFSDR